MVAITINGTVTLDESPTLQTGTDPTNVADGNDIAFSVMSSSADPDVLAFYNRLFGAGQLNQSSVFATTNGIARSAANFIAIDAEGGLVTGLGFDNGSGVALTTYGGTPSAGLLVPNVTAVNGGAVYLFADSVLGNKAALGYDTTGNIVFALLLDPNAAMTQAQVWMVQFEAISNPIFPSDYDEGVNLFDTIGVSASASTKFAFDALPSGNNYFGMVGTTTNALVVVGADPDPVKNSDGSFGFSNDSDTVNTSKGGGSVTIGIDDQNFNPGDGAYFTYVSGANSNYVGKNLDANEADDLRNIDFASRIEVGAASTKVVQVSGDALAIMTIKCFNGNDTLDGQAFGYDDPANPSDVSALGNGSVVAILKIEVMDATGAVIRTLTGAQLVQNGDGAYVVGDLNDNYSVKWYTKVGASGAVHDQTLIGSGAGEKFDIGGFSIDQPNAARADIGSQVIFEDDGPTVTLVNTTNQIRVDESIGQNPGEDETTSLGRVTVSGSDLFTTTFTPGTDGAAATGSSAYSLKVGAANADVDSGLDDTLTGSNVMLHWVDAQTVEGRVGATTTVAFTISINASNGAVTVDLARALVHDDPLDNDEAGTSSLSIDASKLFAIRTVKDGDLDTAAAQVDIGPRIKYEDDGPMATLSLKAVEIRVDESVGANAGEDESGGSLGKVSVLGSDLFTTSAAFGSDGPKATGSSAYSFRISSELTDSGIDDTLTGANILLHKVSDQVIEGRVGNTATVAFVITIDATSGDVSLDLRRALEHDDAADFDESGTSSLSIDASKLFAVRTLTDKDLDTHKAEADIGPAFKFEDDGPSFASQISSKTIDGGDKTPVSYSLNGLSGSDSPAHYTIDKWASLAGYTAVPNDAANVTVVDYLINGTTTVAFRLQVSDTNTLADPDDNSGMYTFTNFLDPPISRQEFDFTFFPSGQSLFGVLLDDDQQGAAHPSSGLLVVGQNVVLDGKGAYLGGTDTINTSQGGGAVTIGVNNQMFDPGDGAVFVYLSNPDRNSCATASKADGLTQTSSDDADVLDFGGTIETKGASIEVVQRQGSDPLGMKLTCYDLSDDGNHDAAFDPLSTKTKKIASDDIGQGRSWMDNPNGDVLSSGAFAKIDSIKVYDTGSTTAKAEFTINVNTGVVTVITGGGITVVADQDHDGDYDANDFVTVVGFQDNDTIAFTSATVHDAVLVAGWSGAWDVGGFNIEQGLDSLDVELAFSVAITDADGDVYHGYDTTLDDFSIRLDGTGANNDPNNLPPADFISSYDSAPAPLTLTSVEVLRVGFTDYLL
jgi:hypothetical protein